MKIPHANTQIGRLVEFVFHHPGLSADQIVERFPKGSQWVRDDVRTLRSRGIFQHDDDGTYSLSPEAMHCYTGAPIVREKHKNIVPPRDPVVFRPLRNYSLSHRDDANRMRFVSMATNWN